LVKRLKKTGKAKRKGREIKGEGNYELGLGIEGHKKKKPGFVMQNTGIQV